MNISKVLACFCVVIASLVGQASASSSPINVMLATPKIPSADAELKNAFFRCDRSLLRRATMEPRGIKFTSGAVRPGRYTLSPPIVFEGMSITTVEIGREGGGLRIEYLWITFDRPLSKVMPILEQRFGKLDFDPKESPGAVWFGYDEEAGLASTRVLQCNARY